MQKLTSDVWIVTILRVQTRGTNLWRNLVGLYLSRYWARESLTARFEFCLDCEITLARSGNLMNWGADFPFVLSLY